MSEATISVPKFGSFRPKPSASVPAQPVPDKGDKDKLRSRDKQRDEGRRHDEHRHRHRRSKESSYEREANTEPVPPPREKSPDIFVVDRKGDVKNLVYGSVHRYSVPHFHRFGAGNVLGASPREKIDRDVTNEKGIVLCNWKDFRTNAREKYIFSKAERERPRLLKLRSEDILEEAALEEADYVPLQTGGKRRKRSGEEGTDSEGDSSHYRSIEGKAKAKDEPLDDAFQYASDSSDSGGRRAMQPDSSVKQKSIDLARKVEQSPEDIRAWMALINHQDTLLEAGHNGRRITNAEIQSTADIKIHMYEKALEKAKNLTDREVLLLGLMAEGAKFWEIKVQADRWEQISKENINSLVLWKSYLDFRQSMFSAFRYEDVREVFLARKALLLKTISTTPADQVEPLYQQLLYVLLRLTVFIREAGYTELAIAIWQGVLELNFCAPVQQVSNSFREFWESEMPRIGETGSSGWRNFIEARSDDSALPEPIVDQPEALFNHASIFKDWVAAERLRTKEAHQPAKTLDEVIENDPFRVILFSDIEDSLIFLPCESKSLQKWLLDAFLVFCQLPSIAPQDGERLQNWSFDSFLSSDMLNYDAAWVERNYFRTPNPDLEEGRGQDLSPLLEPISKFAISSESLFGGNWFQILKPWREIYGDKGPLSYSWVKNTLKQIVTAYFREDLAEYYLAFEFINEPKTIKKACKDLLKQHPLNLRLYNAYAMIEWSRGNIDISKGVFSAALGMSKSMSDDDKRYSIILWRNWIWALLEAGDKSTALQHILSIPEGAPNQSITVTPTSLLKTQKHLSSTRDYLLSTKHILLSVMHAEMLAILSYLTSTSSTEPQSETQGNITSALNIFTTFSSALSSRTLGNYHPHILLLQSASRLLLHHAHAGPYRPSLLSTHLTRFLSLYPSNTIFLSLISSPLISSSTFLSPLAHRTLFTSLLLTPLNDTLSTRVFIIRYEILHGTIHSAHSAFKSAISSPVGKNSPALWKLYILFLVANKEVFGRKMVQEVWERAISSCPWCKEVYLVGFEVLAGMGKLERAEEQEMRGVWRILGEKELRVHVDLEEVWEDIDEARMIE